MNVYLQQLLAYAKELKKYPSYISGHETQINDEIARRTLKLREGGDVDDDYILKNIKCEIAIRRGCVKQIISYISSMRTLLDLIEEEAQGMFDYPVPAELLQGKRDE